MDVTIDKSTVNDLCEILELQKLSYQKEAILYDDWSIPPLMQTISEITAEYGNSIFLKAQCENKIVGSVRASFDFDTCRIGKLFVHPDYRKMGIGSLLMKSMESFFKNAKRFDLFTGVKSTDNIRLYKKLGYKECCKKELSTKIKIIFMEKMK
ncbi:MAG: GNAT family N-acetyltransferase [Desulfobulbus sp.]